MDFKKTLLSGLVTLALSAPVVAQTAQIVFPLGQAQHSSGQGPGSNQGGG